MRYLVLAFILVAIAAFLIAGPPRGSRFQNPPMEIFPDMDRQSKVKYQKPSSFFADGAASRPPAAGTVPFGYQMPGHESKDHLLARYEYSRGEGYFSTGRMDKVWGDGLPAEVPADATLLVRGHERYDIYCAVCHGKTGAGNGIASQYGIVGIANLHDQRLREMPDGQLYNTVANGKGLMFGYGDRLPLRDRWAIVAYIRVLQKSKTGGIDDVPPADRANLGSNPSSTSDQVATHE